jgi:hypothetical protein
VDTHSNHGSDSVSEFNNSAFEVDLDVDEDDEAEIEDEATLLTFAATLQKAHNVAIAAEKAKHAQNNHPQHYTGHSTRTNQRNAQKQRDLTNRGVKFITEWCCKKPQTDIMPTEEPVYVPSNSEHEGEPIVMVSSIEKILWNRY